MESGVCLGMKESVQENLRKSDTQQKNTMVG